MVALAVGAGFASGMFWLAACNSQPTAAPKAAAPAITVAVPRPTPPSELAVKQFHQVVEPILRDKCYDCHGDGESRAGVAFDTLDKAPNGNHNGLLKNPELWLKVLKNTRASIMPPPDHPRPTPAEQSALENWIKFAAFGVDPSNPDPGRVTVHRLNRFEYRNTIHDLLGVDFDTDAAFPSDDIGYGFDNIADVLNTSPLLLEKYLAAAQTIVSQAVPTTSRVIPAVTALGRDFRDAKTGAPPVLDDKTYEDGAVAKTAVMTSYFNASKVSRSFPVASEGDYRVVVEQGISANFTYVPANCTVTIFVDGKQMTQKVYRWHGTNANTEKQPSIYDTIPVHWTAGNHEVALSVEPLVGKFDGKNNVYFLLRSVRIEGPADPSKWVHPANYARFFNREDAPADAAGRRAYARELLAAFATKAFRRPVPAESLDDLVNLVEKESSLPGKTFEAGVAQAMVAVLVSPQFMFRIDNPEKTDGAAAYARIDEYSLASRLSYFLWSTMPDEELLRLAAAGQLRTHLAAQVRRMVTDPRAAGMIGNFSGQWLQSRAVLNVPLNTQEIFLREGVNTTPADDLNPVMRTALNEEAQAYFGYVMREDRSVDEFLDSNYMFLNQTLANYYEISPAPTGNAMRKVDLPPGDWRGGVLTLGSVLMVTSNPTRTSPVKRGKWILDNILGAPAPPPPPNIPALEEAANKIAGRAPTMRETLARHRADPMCASCHDRMDPLGLALENFNALGTVRDKDLGQPIDATGKLPTGDSFKDIRDLKHLLLANHREEFYRCLTEKLLTYALGRGMEYYDVPAVDKIVENLDKDGGKFSALLNGIIDSAAFQEERLTPNPPPAASKPMAWSANPPSP